MYERPKRRLNLTSLLRFATRASLPKAIKMRRCERRQSTLRKEGMRSSRACPRRMVGLRLRSFVSKYRWDRG